MHQYSTYLHSSPISKVITLEAWMGRRPITDVVLGAVKQIAPILMTQTLLMVQLQKVSWKKRKKPVLMQYMQKSKSKSNHSFANQFQIYLLILGTSFRYPSLKFENLINQVTLLVLRICLLMIIAREHINCDFTWPLFSITREVKI